MTLEFAMTGIGNFSTSLFQLGGSFLSELTIFLLYTMGVNPRDLITF